MKSKLDAIRDTFPVMAPQQLALALEMAVFSYVESYIAAHPLPEGTTDTERADMHDIMMAISLTESLNAAANMLTQPRADTLPTEQQKADAADAAAAVIAKASGKLN